MAIIHSSVSPPDSSWRSLGSDTVPRRRREAHIDIADWLIRYLLMPSPEDAWRRNSGFLKAMEFISEDKQEEFLGAEKNPL